MTHRLEGIPISPGYAEGVAVIYDFEIDHRLKFPDRDISISEITAEHGRLNSAVENSHRELSQTEQPTRDSTSVLATHAELVRDIATRVRQYMGRELVNVEQSLDSVIGGLVERLCEVEDLYLRQREQDIRDVGRRMMRHLTGAPRFLDIPLPPETVIVASELLPSEVVELSHANLVAIITEHGGKDSHTAILARSLGIPLITAIPTVTSHIEAGSHLLIDGHAGTVTIAPTASEQRAFSQAKQDYQRANAAIAAAEVLPCLTKDGINVSLLANVGRPEELEQIKAHNLTGVGLFRTEFLFLESEQRPTLETQREIYARAADELVDRTLVIRTFDLGGDKLPPFLASSSDASHPYCDLRGLRFSLAERQLLETQIQAIIEVAQTADVRILFPMVIGHDDFSQAVSLVDRITEELGLSRRPAIGVMIETPAILFAMEEVLELADFATIGTNDLTQYILAADRGTIDPTGEFSPWHPAVLRAIKHIVGAAAVKDCTVCVCGEEAGEADFASLLVGLGIRELSMTPVRAAAVRYALRKLDSSTARELAHSALRCETALAARQLFSLQHSAPEAVAGDAPLA